jgi:hypothetical protein
VADVAAAVVADRPVAGAVTAARIKFAATVVMGVLLPLLSVGLSSVGGNLARREHLMLSGFAFGLMVCVLTVSLSHLAWAISDITRSPGWACCCKAQMQAAACGLSIGGTRSGVGFTPRRCATAVTSGFICPARGLGSVMSFID